MALIFKSSWDDSAFAAGLRRMEQQAASTAAAISSGFSKLGSASGVSVGGLGGLLLGGGVVAGASSIVSHLSDIADAAAAANLSVEEFQQVSFAFTQSGASSEEARKGVFNLTKALVEARDPASKQAEAMERLGLSLKKTNEADIIGAVGDIADAYKNASDKGRALADISELYGAKLANKLVPALSEGGAEFRRLAESADIATRALVEFGNRTGDAVDEGAKWLKNRVAGTYMELGRIAADKFNRTFQETQEAGLPEMIGQMISAGGAIKEALGRAFPGVFGETDPDAIDPKQLAEEDKIVKEKQRQKEAIIADIERQAIAAKGREMEKIGLQDIADKEKAMAEQAKAFEKEELLRQKMLGEFKLAQLEAQWEKEKQIRADALNARNQALQNFANQMAGVQQAGGDLIQDGIARELMTPAQRREADKQEKLRKNAEEKFLRKHPEIVRAMEMAKAMEAKAKKDLEAKLSDAQIKQIVDGFKQANEELLVK